MDSESEQYRKRSGSKMQMENGIRDLHKMCCLLRISGIKKERDVKDFSGMKF
jgi:hypothetical protein